MIVLDTDLISELMRGHRPELSIRLAAIPLDQQATTTINLGELAYGSARANRADYLERALTLLAGVTILPFDREAALRYGAVRAHLESQGLVVAEPDLRIAAIALATGATLITGNTAHFEHIPGLAIENWLWEA